MPGIVTRARLWLRSLIEPRRFDQDLSDELRFHLDARARELTRRGLPPDEAARRARLEFGNSDNVRDDVRGVRRGLWVEQLLQDVRYAVRMCRRFPGFSLAASRRNRPAGVVARVVSCPHRRRRDRVPRTFFSNLLGRRETGDPVRTSDAPEPDLVSHL
jgi:hypothetical protein